MSFQLLEVRMAHLEGAYEQINLRLGGVEQRLSNLEIKIDGLRDSLEAKMDARFAQVDQKFLWVIGLIVVSILIPLAEKFATR